MRLPPCGGSHAVHLRMPLPDVSVHRFTWPLLLSVRSFLELIQPEVIMFTVIFMGFAVLCMIGDISIAGISVETPRESANTRNVSARGHGPGRGEAQAEPMIRHDVVNGRTPQFGSERGRSAIWSDSTFPWSGAAEAWGRERASLWWSAGERSGSSRRSRAARRRGRPGRRASVP